jgi:hypothetical protein
MTGREPVVPGAVEPGAVEPGAVEPDAIGRGEVAPDAVEPDAAEPAPATPGWLRRNAIGLGAAVVALALAVGVLVVQPLERSAPAGPKRVVPMGDSYTWHGREFSIRAAGIDGADDGTVVTPPRTGLVAVLVTVTATSAAKPLEVGTCDIRLTAPGAANGEDREWSSESNPSRFRYGTRDDSTSVCLLDEPEDRLIEQVFLVPKRTYDSAVLDITLNDASSRTVVRFRLPDDPVVF